MHLRANKLPEPGLVVTEVIEESSNVCFKLLEALSPFCPDDVLLEIMP